MGDIHHLPNHRLRGLPTEQQARVVHRRISDEIRNEVSAMLLVDRERENWRGWYRHREQIDHPLGWLAHLTDRVGHASESVAAYTMTDVDARALEAERRCIEIAAVALELRDSLRRSRGR